MNTNQVEDSCGSSDFDNTFDNVFDKKYVKNSYIYTLNAFIIHEGHPLQGHKIAFCLDENENKWYRFDDSKVTVCKNPFKQEVAFLFFYQRINNYF